MLHMCHQKMRKGWTVGNICTAKVRNRKGEDKQGSCRYRDVGMVQENGSVLK